MVNYNISKDIINYHSELLLPIMSNGLFDRSRKPIVINKEDENDKICILSLGIYEMKIEDLKDKINNSKLGYIFQLINDEYSNYELDTERIRYINIDEELLKIQV